MWRGAVPSEPDNLFGNVARILRRMTHLVQHFFRSIFDMVGHIEFNLPPLICCNFVYYFGFFEKTGSQEVRTSKLSLWDLDLLLDDLHSVSTHLDDLPARCWILS